MTIEKGKKLLCGLFRIGEQDRAGLNPNDPVIDRIVADAGIIVADDEDEIATRQNEEANGWSIHLPPSPPRT